MLADHQGLRVGTGLAPEGLLLGRPGSDGGVGNASWIVYESGSVVLRRSRFESDALQSACFHLASLNAAIHSTLLPLRLRTILLPDGTALLTEPAVLHDLAGHDRQLASRGYVVLPTTVALIDSDTAEFVLPAHHADAVAEGGRRRISSVVLLDKRGPSITGSATLLALLRSVLRHPGLDLGKTLRQVDQLTGRLTGCIELTDSESITQIVRHLGREK